MSEFPLVSVIIPTYNRAYVVHKAIESILAQTYKNIEIIVVDDGSIDNTDQVIANYKQVVHIKKQHEGQAEARNAGLTIAKGEYLASLDSDDVWKENFLSIAMGYLLLHKLDMFFSNWEYCIGNHDDFTNALEGSLEKKYIIHSFHLFEYHEYRQLLIQDNISPSSGIIIRRTYMSKIWDKRIHIGDDSLLQLELILSNVNTRIGFTTDLLWRKNRSIDSVCDGRVSISYRKLHIEDLELTITKLKSFLTPKERQILTIKIIQNHIYIIYLSLSSGAFNNDLKKSLQKVVNKPLFAFTALHLGVKKYYKQKLSGLK
jgi:glycosyltransferase involved in cell wall biosynthesis